MDNPGKCDLCGEEASERCPDGVCRRCHVTCSWEDCVSGAFERKIIAMDRVRIEVEQNAQTLSTPRIWFP